MRIVYLNPCGSLGGAETSLRELLASVRTAEPDWDLWLVLGEDGPLAEAARRSGIEATAILPGLLPDAFDMLFAAAELPTSATVRPLYLRPPDAKPPAPSPLVGAGA